MPLKPSWSRDVPLNDARASALQFRYLFVTDARRPEGDRCHRSEGAASRAEQHDPLGDAQRVFVARTYAYVAAGKDGLVIVDVEKPESDARVPAVQRRTARSTTRAT